MNRLPHMVEGRPFYEGGTFLLSVDDLTFDADGNFKPEMLSVGHANCLQQFIRGCEELFEREGTLIVDNTNTSAWEVSPYIQTFNAIVGKEGGEIEVVVFLKDWRMCAERNTHGTPAGIVRRMARQLDRTLDDYPPFFPPVKLI